jgi:hypothetical protein
MNAAAAVRPDAAQLARGLRAWLDGRTEAEAATSLVVATEPPAPPVPPGHTRPLLAWLAVGLAAVVFSSIVPMAAANWLNQAPATLDLARAQIDHIAVAAAPSPDTTPATSATPAPVLVATAPQPTPGSGGGGGGGGGGGHHHKHHKHHHGHGH